MQSNLRKNPKRFWNFVNSKRKNRDGVPATVTLLEEVATTASEKCNLYAKHFASVFSTTNAPLDQVKLPAVPVPENACDVGSPVVTEDMLRKAVQKIKSSSVPGPDGIPAIIYKRCNDALITPLCRIFNLSLQQKKFPELWKESFMFPVYKKGNKHDVRNYRDHHKRLFVDPYEIVHLHGSAWVLPG